MRGCEDCGEYLLCVLGVAVIANYARYLCSAWRDGFFDTDESD